MTLRAIHRRVVQLEKLRPLPTKCPLCGNIDLEHGGGPFGVGVVIRQDDGRSSCFCKWCGRSFEALITRDERSRCLVSDARPVEIAI